MPSTNGRPCQCQRLISPCSAPCCHWLDCERQRYPYPGYRGTSQQFSPSYLPCRLSHLREDTLLSDWRRHGLSMIQPYSLFWGGGDCAMTGSLGIAVVSMLSRLYHGTSQSSHIQDHRGKVRRKRWVCVLHGLRSVQSMVAPPSTQGSFHAPVHEIFSMSF